MKIYINHLNLDALPELLKSLNNNYINSETYIKIYSIDGIYEINNSSSKKLIPQDSDIEILENYHENFTLLDDKHFYKRISNEYGIAPNDIYFELPEETNINDALVKNELNVFLSCLN